MVTCPSTSHFCPCGLDICPPYLGFPLRRTDLPQILYHDMDRPSLPWKIIFWLSTCVVLSVSLQEFSVVQERFIPPLLPNLVLPELAERWRFSPPFRDLSAYKLSGTLTGLLHQHSGRFPCCEYFSVCPESIRSSNSLSRDGLMQRS